MAYAVIELTDGKILISTQNDDWTVDDLACEIGEAIAGGGLDIRNPLLSTTDNTPGEEIETGDAFIIPTSSIRVISVHPGAWGDEDDDIDGGEW